MLFVDTFAWIALRNKSDNYHLQALATMNIVVKQKRRLVTSDYVLVEVADAFARPTLRTLAVSLLSEILENSDGLIEVVPASRELLSEGFQRYSGRLDKGWSLTDCISMVVMERWGITEVFTNDHHFRQAGFTTLI